MDEDSIKAQLRQLTEQSRKLRVELEEMLKPPAHPDNTRALIHVQSWPRAGRPPDSSHDGPKRSRRRRK